LKGLGKRASSLSPNTIFHERPSTLGDRHLATKLEGAQGPVRFRQREGERRIDEKGDGRLPILLATVFNSVAARRKPALRMLAPPADFLPFLRAHVCQFNKWPTVFKMFAYIKKLPFLFPTQMHHHSLHALRVQDRRICGQFWARGEWSSIKTGRRK
jgi:hypothetical protein